MAAITVWTIAANLLAIAGLLLIVYRTRNVGWWILIAACAALALDPVVTWLVRHGLRRGLAVTAVVVTGLGLAALVLATLAPVLVEQGRNLIASAPQLLDRLRESQVVQWADGRFDLIDRAKQEVTSHAAGAAAPVFAFVQNIFTGVIGTITVTALTVFMLLFGGRLFEGALQWIAPAERPRYRDLAERIQRSVGGYVGGAAIIALIGGIVTAIATALLGVPYFLPLGVTMAVLGILPYVGSILGGVLVVSATFLTSGIKAGLIALVVFLLYQQVENHVLQPVVQRKTIRMSPLVIAVVMLIGTALWGLMGALLSLPIAGTIQVLLEDRLSRRQARWQARPPSDRSTAPTEASASGGIAVPSRA